MLKQYVKLWINDWVMLIIQSSFNQLWTKKKYDVFSDDLVFHVIMAKK